MNEKNMKLCILTILVVGLFLGSYFTVPIQLELKEQEGSEQRSPESAIDVGPFDRNGTGSNLGLLGEAQLRMQNTTYAESQYWIPRSELGNRYTQGPFGPFMPRPSAGVYWKVSSVSVTASGLRDVNNWVPSDNFASGWTYFSTTDSVVRYSDTYWSPTNQVTDTKQILTVTGTGTNPYQGDSVAFSTQTTSGFMEVAPARRQYTFQMGQGANKGDISISPQLIQSQSVSNMKRRWGTLIESTKNWANPGGEAGTEGYAANYDDGTPTSNSQLITATSGWSWGDVRVNNNYGVTDAATANSQKSYDTWAYAQRFVRLWYRATKTSTSASTFKAIASAWWDRPIEYATTASQDFYYNAETGQSIHNARFSANVLFTNYQPPQIAGIDNDDFGGQVRFSIVVPGGSITTLKDTAFNRYTDFNLDNINTAFSISNYDLSSFFSSTGLYKLQVYVRIYARVRSNGWLETEGPNIARGSTGNSVVNYAFNHHWVGITVRVSNIITTLQDEIQINNGQAGDMKVYFESSPSDGQFQNRIVASDGIPPRLQYDYMIRPGIVGYLGTNTGLTPRMFAELYIYHANGTVFTINHNDSVDWAALRNLNPNGWGTGCNRFIWDLNQLEISRLNNASWFQIRIGFFASKTWEMDYNMGTGQESRVYMKNANFTFTTIPRAESVQLALAFKKAGYGFNQLEYANFTSNQGYTSASVVLQSKPLLTTYNPTGGDGFYFITIMPSLLFNYEFTINITYETWDVPSQFIYKNGDKTYFISNYTFVTPHPVNLTGRWYSPLVQYSYNDNFNLTLIIPKFTLQDNSTFWKVENIRDKSHPNYLAWTPTSELTYWTQPSMRALYVYLDNAPPNIYGDTAYTNGKIQTVRLDKELYISYTGTVAGTPLNLCKNLSLDMTFSHPSSLVTVLNNENSVFTTHQDVFYRGVNLYSRANFSESINSSGTKNVQFLLYKSNTTSPHKYSNNVTFTTQTYMYASSPFNTSMISNDELGPDFYSMAIMNVTNVCGVPRTTERYLAGVYRGGIAVNTLGIYATTQVGNLSYYYANTANEIVGNVILRDSNNGTGWERADTYYFDTPNHSNQKLEIRVDYRNDLGQAITGATAIFNAYYYSNDGTVYKRLINVVQNKDMIDYNNGTYGIFLEPSANFPNAGNISQAFHLYNISLSKDNYAPQTINGNFSIAIPTKLRITNPPFGSYYLKGGKYYMNYEGEKFLAGFTYSWSATYQVDGANETYITNNYGNYFEGNVFVTYNLTNISEFENPTTVINYSAYVNYTYFMNDNSTNKPWLYDDLNPVNGTFASFQGDNTLYAQMRWPNFQSDYYENSPSLTEWGRQTNGTTFLLHYNVYSRVRVNRTGFSETNEGRFFQPNDVVYAECKPFEGQDNTDFSVQRETNLRLISPTNGNWTRIIPMNRAEDGNPYDMGVFNLDEENIMDFDNSKKDNKTITWTPNFIIENYRNNLTASAFRLRVQVNCSVSDVAEANEWFAGFKDSETFVPIGPLNNSGEMYGVNLNVTNPNTNVVLTGWNGTQLNFTADPTVLWSAPVTYRYANGTNISITAYGVTYVSDWILWNSTSTGQKQLVITVLKENFIFSQVRITANVLSAPTKVYNASVDNPAEIPEMDLTVGGYREFRTKIGIPRSLVINFTDMTNNASGIYLPIDAANIEMIEDTSLIYKSDETGEYWNWTALGNGLYNITLKYMHWPWDYSQYTFQLKFRLTKENYDTKEFGLRVIVDKRNIQMEIVEWMNITMKYPFDSNKEGSTDKLLSISSVNATIRFYDLDASAYVSFPETYIIGGETPIKIYYYDYQTGQPDNQSNYDYYKKIVPWTRLGQPVYNVTFYRLNDLLGIQNVSISLYKAMNYTDADVTYSYEIIVRNAVVQFRSNESEVEYYTVDDYRYGPSFDFNYQDESYVSQQTGQTLIWELEKAEVQLNFSGFYDVGRSSNPSFVSNLQLNTYNISVGEFFVNCTFVKEFYNSISAVIKVIIRNATSQISLIEYHISTNKQFDESKWSYRYADPITVPWDYIAQFRVEYRDNRGQVLTDDPAGSIHMTIENVIAPMGVQIYTVPDKICLYFFTNISESDPTPISFTAVIWKDNYQPVTKDINVTVINRETSIVMIPAVKDIAYRGKIRFDFNFYDISVFTNPLLILNAKLYFDNETVGIGNYSYYYFNGSAARVGFKAIGDQGNYIIEVDTANLSAGYYYTFIAEIGKDHFNKQMINHTFYIRPTRIEGFIFFTLDSNPPDESQTYLNIITLTPDIESFYIWVKPYVEITAAGTETKSRVYLTGDDVKITITVRDDQKIGSDNKTEVLTIIELDYDSQKGIFFAKFNVKWVDGLTEKQLATINTFEVNMTSKNPSYDWNKVEGRVLILKGTNELPGWFYILLAITVGAAVSMGSYGIRQMLKWRIPYVLRMIDESIEQIKNDKMPPVGVMTGRSEFVIKQVLEYLDQAGIVWSISDKFEESEGRDEDEDAEGQAGPSGKPYTHEELVALLAKIESLTADERALFIEELKRMDRKAQEEFLQSLREE